MKRILFIVYKYFDEDPRPQREAAALLAEGYEVDVICVRRPGDSRDSGTEGLRFYSPVMDRKRGNKLRYIAEYLYFLLYALFKSTWLKLTRRYKVIQVFVMPTHQGSSK